MINRRRLETGGKQEYSTYDTVSDVLDFVPIVGGLNRFSRGEYTEGLINLGLDALGPLKYIAKGVKGIRTLANMSKVAKRQRQFTRYQKAIDRIATRAENLSKQGKDYSREADAIKRLSKKANKVGEKATRYKKAIKDNVISVGGKVIDDLSYTPRIAIASGVHKAMDQETTKDALSIAFKSAVKDYSYNPEINDPGDAFLLSDSQQKKFMENLGYFKTTDEDGVKKIKKATDALVKFRLGRKPNIYQLGNDQIPRDSVIAINEEEVPSSILNNYSKSISLIHAGDNPTIYYRHKNPNKKEYYYREIDLNDYGKHIKQEGTEYGPIQYLANAYDFVGNPFIQKTGIIRLDNDSYYQPTIQTNKNNSYKNGGSIHIAPSKRGTFTAAATKHGMGVQEFAARVLRNKEDYSPSLVKKANFARNASKWH